MSWVAVGVAAVGAVKGSMDAKAAKKKQAKHDAFRKKAMAYSPWTGMGDVGPGNFGNTDSMSGALGGGMQGFAMGSMMSGAGGTGGDMGASAMKTGAPQMTSDLGGSNLGGGLGGMSGGMGGMQMPQQRSAYEMLGGQTPMKFS